MQMSIYLATACSAWQSVPSRMLGTRSTSTMAMPPSASTMQESADMLLDPQTK
jgi:hypothetical protein